MLLTYVKLRPGREHAFRRLSSAYFTWRNPNLRAASVYASRELLALYFTYAYATFCLPSTMGVDNTVAIQVPAKDPK